MELFHASSTFLRHIIRDGSDKEQFHQLNSVVMFAGGFV